MNAREALYISFPRNVGNPAQHPVQNWEQLNRFITENSGLNDQCYASTCSYQNNRAVFEDLFLEMDSLELSPIIAVGKWFTENGIYWIPLFSGNRGIHIHALFSPEIVQSQTVRDFADFVIDQTHTKGMFDNQVTGDMRRLARIPNTKRLNELWCIPLSQEDVLNNISPSEIIKKAKSPQFIQYYPPTKKPKITDFVKDIKPIHDDSKPIISQKSNILLKSVLRPCIYEKIYQPNPRDNTRITATVEALRQGMSIKQLLDIYEEMKWIDFDRNYTLYQIEHINKRVQNGTIKPLGKKRLGCTLKRRCITCILTGEMK
jgi:hypothetical protein